MGRLKLGAGNVSGNEADEIDSPLEPLVARDTRTVGLGVELEDR